MGMKVGGGLRYVTGPMGAGKTLYGVRSIVPRLVAGQYVVTNVRLLDDAPDRIAAHFTRSKRKRQVVADKVRRHYIFEAALDEAIRYWPPGSGESRALFVWDEAHNDLNNRTYRDREQGLLEYFTQLRKLGFEGVLLTQSQDNTDAQLRRICNWAVRLQNQRESHRVLGMRLKFLPPLFLASWFMANTPFSSKTRPLLVERYTLTWHKRLYDTFDLFHGLAGLDPETQDRLIRLPEGGRLPTTAGALPRASAEAPDGGPTELDQPMHAPDSAIVTAQTERAALPTRPAPDSDTRIRRAHELPTA